MKLAFCLFKYFPFGGLQRDFLRIARECKQRGHEIHVFTMQWEGPIELDFNLHLIPVSGWQNHTRAHYFIKKVNQEFTKNNFDIVIGFNKMMGLDIYYAADVCYQERLKFSFLNKLLPRRRQWIAAEKAVFSRGSHTNVLLISHKQQQAFEHYYSTEKDRFHLLPPGISRNCIAPANAAEIRAKVRHHFQISDHERLLLLVGSGFKTKGLDRVLKGLASLTNKEKSPCHLFVIGQDNPSFYKKLAKNLEIDHKVNFLGGRSDVPDFLLAADLLVHPAYHENTGTVLLEAVVAGLPVLTVDVCGYAKYVQEAQAGIVLSSPFNQSEFNTALEKMISFTNKGTWHKQGLLFGKQMDLYSMPEKAVDFIEQYPNRFGFKRAQT